MTNNHVVALAADGGTMSVLFSDGKRVPATLVGRDALTDIAVIRVSESKLPAIPEGKSAGLRVGQPVIVLGAPLGLSSTVTSGIVSALDRTIEVPGEDGHAALLIDAIQTDAAINPGNSGGALVNCGGQFVGIPSAGTTVPSESGGAASAGSIGLGFAIPADLAIREFNEVVATGKVTHAYTGLQAYPLGGHHHYHQRAASRQHRPGRLHHAQREARQQGGHRLPARRQGRPGGAHPRCPAVT